MLDSATLTITGNVVADPKVVGPASQPDRVTFRLVSNRRRRDQATGEWKQVGEYGINVVCWRRLARGVAQALRKGDPVVVIGQVTERSFLGDDQQTHWRTELTADFVGHDLTLGYAARFNRFTQIDGPQPRRDGDGVDGTDEASGSGSGGADGDDEASGGAGSPVDFPTSGDFDDDATAVFETGELLAARA